MTQQNLPTLVFYEKPGCSSNAQQKKLLRAVGFKLDERSLLAEPWSGPSLMNYFGETPVAQWFNTSAPRVKQGLVKPAELTAQQAIELMLREPLLIRRPLIHCGKYHWLGFNLPALLADLNLPPEYVDAGIEASEKCSGTATACELQTEHISDATQRCGL